jgi:predicted ArsR family transcriptional regulator
MPSEPLFNTPGDRILFALKRGGSATHASLAVEIGVSAEAIRQQMCRLEDAGLVRARDVVRGVGRPTRVWELTDCGHARFPDRHDQLASNFIATAQKVLGQDAVDEVIRERGRDVEATYAAELADLPIAERVERLAARRTEEGYLAEHVVEADGAHTLLEHHCSIRAAAQACQGFCAEELRVFRALFPDATVERTEHLMSGGRRCVYRIVPREHEPSS